MVRLSDAGWSVPRIAAHFGVHHQTVRYWIKAYLAGGFDALDDRPHTGQRSAITEEIGKLEGRIDDLHDIGLKELFLKHRSGNTMDFVVGAEIYKHPEKVSDRFDDVANEINSIVIEQV